MLPLYQQKMLTGAGLAAGKIFLNAMMQAEQREDRRVRSKYPFDGISRKFELNIINWKEIMPVLPSLLSQILLRHRNESRLLTLLYLGWIIIPIHKLHLSLTPKLFQPNEGCFSKFPSANVYADERCKVS